MKNHSSNDSPDLFAIAHQALTEAGFLPDVPAGVTDEVRAIDSGSYLPTDPGAKDLRALLWSSIDNSSSRDLDQVEYAETGPNGDTRLLVGIADVDVLVQKGTAIDDYAAKNGTSVYTGVKTFSMLPDKLSTDLTSLVEGADRAAIVMEMVVDNAGAVKSTDVYQARLRNHAKLSYESVGAWLDKNGAVPSAISNVAGLEAQVRLQLDAAMRLHELRKLHGALELDTIESVAVLSVTGEVTDLAVTERNSARNLIENFMIAANVAMAQFLETRSSLSLRRVVRTPEHWERITELAQGLGETLPSTPDSLSLAGFLERRKLADPLHFPDLSLSIVKLLGPGEYSVQKKDSPGSGHFGLAVHDYTHSTAPNRRYADLVTQRLVKAVLRGAATPYTETELSAIAAHCTEREDAARKVERKMRKVAAAVFLRPRVGEEFSAIVTGVTPKGTFARLLNPPVDGRIMHGEAGLHVGDKVRVRLDSTNPQLGFIDFSRLGNR